MDEVEEVVNEPTGGGFVFDEFKPPSPEDLLSILDSLGLNEVDKEQLKKELLYRQETGEMMPPEVVPAPVIYTAQYMMFVTVVVLIVVFVGYKLYKSLTDKERKREEKKMQKQQKKKK